MLLMDHRNLTVILGPKKGVPPLAAVRLQRWALLLSAYQYTIKFCCTQDHANADGLSRLQVKGTQPIGNFSHAEEFNAAQMQVLPVTADQLQTATRKDPILGLVLRFTRYGWPDSVSEVFKPYWHRRWELSV